CARRGSYDGYNCYYFDYW
nr:immunoglobulin heavy chain junction region [Mus musculus]